VEVLPGDKSKDETQAVGEVRVPLVDIDMWFIWFLFFLINFRLKNL
jgi:hypothetical protein